MRLTSYLQSILSTALAHGVPFKFKLYLSSDILVNAQAPVLHDMAPDQLNGLILDNTNSHLDHYCELVWCHIRPTSNIQRRRTSSNLIFLLIKLQCPRLNGPLPPTRLTFTRSHFASSPLPFSAPLGFAFSTCFVTRYLLGIAVGSVSWRWVELRHTELWASFLGILACSDLSYASLVHCLILC